MKNKTNDMKTIGVIPDLHEKDIWKTFVSDKTVDTWVFLGDYVDSFDHDDAKCINNLRDIIAFKQSNLDNVILLLGNHDMSYFSQNYRCSGFHPSTYPVLHDVYTREHKDLFQVAYQQEEYLFTHAGVSKNWYEFNLNTLLKFLDEGESLADTLNKIQLSSHQPILHSVSYLRGGSESFGGITWADKRETENSLLWYKQVVGHSRVPDIITISPEEHGGKRSITYTDCLDKLEKYLRLEL